MTVNVAEMELIPKNGSLVFDNSGSARVRAAGNFSII
jgi:hypothetical protein